MQYHPSENPECVQFYLAREEKKLFKKACRSNDSTMSREIRRMIRHYIKHGEYFRDKNTDPFR